jgi:hypothetical protein
MTSILFPARVYDAHDNGNGTLIGSGAGNWDLRGLNGITTDDDGEFVAAKTAAEALDALEGIARAETEKFGADRSDVVITVMGEDGREFRREVRV